MTPPFESWSAMVAAREAYLAGLPQWVHAWIGWMTFTFVSSIWFAIPHREARVVLAVSVLTALGADVFGWFFGFSRLWGLVHLVLWIPLIIYLAPRTPRLKEERSAYAIWLNALIVTMGISLIFDAIDVVRYLAAGG